MRPRISPSRNCRSTSSTAVMPPKRLFNASVSSSTGASASGATRFLRRRLGCVVRLARPPCRAFAPAMNTERSTSGRSSRSDVGSFEAHLALLHEHGAFGQVQRHVDGLFDQHDRRAACVDLLHDFEELGDDRRRETERQFVDHQQPRASHQRGTEGEHLLLAARQVAGQLALATLEDREQRLHFLLAPPRPVPDRRESSTPRGAGSP